MKNAYRWLTAWAVAGLVLLSIILPWPSAADTASADDSEAFISPELVVTGVIAPRTAALVPASITILSGDEIDASPSANVSDLLRSVSGLHLQQNGARGGNAVLYLRGLDPNHVLVLVDGIRLNDPNNTHGGSFDPTTLALLDIDRIEIVRGPLSSTYGSDALAGAINIITRRTASDDTLSLSVNSGGGRFGTGHVRGRVSSGVGWAGLSVAGGYETSDDPFSDGGYRGGNLKASLDSRLPGEIDVRFDLRFSSAEAKAFPESSGGRELAVIRDLENRDTKQLSIGFSANKQATDWLELNFRLEYLLSREDVNSPGVAPSPGVFVNGVPPTVSSSDLDRTKLSVLGTATPIPSLQFTTGADIEWEDGKSPTVYQIDFGMGVMPVSAGFKLDRRVVGWFLEGNYDFDWGVALSGSVRGDFSETHLALSGAATDDLPKTHRMHWSPNLGATVQVPRTPVTLYGSWGEGFKLPSFFALGNGLAGNPRLAPERSRGWEVGARGSFFDDRLFTRIAYFDIEVAGLIDFDPEKFKIVNRHRLESRGVELETEVAIMRRLRFGGSATFNPTNLVNDPVDVRNRPRWQGELHLAAQPIPSLEIGVRALFVGSVKATSNPTGVDAVSLDDWQRVDFTAAWIPRDWIKLYLVIENLLDANYSEAVGFPAVGIYPRAGLELRY